MLTSISGFGNVPGTFGFEEDDRQNFWKILCQIRIKLMGNLIHEATADDDDVNDEDDSLDGSDQETTGKRRNLIETENIYGTDDAEELCDTKPFGSVSEAGTSLSETTRGFHDDQSPSRKRRRTSRRLKNNGNVTFRKEG